LESLLEELGKPATAVVEQLSLDTWNVIVPVGAKPPVTVTASVADPDVVVSVIVEGETRVVTVGEASWTVRGSHALAAPTLFPSPLYAAFQLYEPREVKVCGAEAGTTPPVTVTRAPTWVCPLPQAPSA